MHCRLPPAELPSVSLADDGTSRIVLVGDDRAIAGTLVADLARLGSPPSLRDDVEEVLRGSGSRPRVVLLAWAPGATADALARLRRNLDDPVVILSDGTERAEDRVRAFEAGADDWFGPGVTGREALARIAAILRRVPEAAPPPSPPPGPAAPRAGSPAGSEEPPRRIWRLSPDRRELYAPDGRALGLTSAEFDVLHALARARGAPVTRDALSQAAFRRPWYPDDRAVDNVAARLRKKLAAHSSNPDIIKPVRSVGYVFTGF